MLYYNKYIEKLENEKALKEFNANIVVNNLRENIEGIPTKKEIVIQYKLLQKILFVGSVVINLMFFIFN